MDKSENQILLEDLGFVFSDKLHLWQAPAPSFLAYTQRDVDIIAPVAFKKMLKQYFKEIE